MAKRYLYRIFAPLALLLLISLPACDFSTNYHTPGGQFYKLAVSSVDSVAIQRDEITFGLTVQLPNSCYYYNHTNVSRNRNNVYVTLYGGRLNRMCTQVVTPTSVEIGLEKPRPGKYNFHFNGHDSTSVDTTITIENSRGERY